MSFRKMPSTLSLSVGVAPLASPAARGSWRARVARASGRAAPGFATSSSACILQCTRIQPLSLRRRHGAPSGHRHAAVGCNASSSASMADTEAVSVSDREGIPAAPGVYAMIDGAGAVQYIGLSRKVAASVDNHMTDVPELLEGATCKVGLVGGAGSKDVLQALWKQWMQEYVTEFSALPPGNVQGVTTWTKRKVAPAKPMLRLTPGKGAEDLSVPMVDLLDQVVKSEKIVAFIKGTRTKPECGFSHQVLTILTEEKVDFEAVDVMDEEFNPGVRDAIKEYSTWPTIPQVYMNGEMVGGAEILAEMRESGELRELAESQATDDKA